MILFVPIKENSQRVPRKNFRYLGDEPLYKHSLLKFTDCEVYVDTDSIEIMEQITKDHRLSHVTVYKRPHFLIGDEVSVCDLVKNFITRYQITSPIAQVHVTSPFLNQEILMDASAHLKTYDSVVACTTHQARFWRAESYGYCPVNHNPVKMEQTQDLPVLYEENSAFYIFNPEVIKGTGSRVGQNPYFYAIGEPYNLDIDTEEDWENVLKEIKNERNN
jgi:CMP-N-acetylneuraminic acid synthetase